VVGNIVPWNFPFDLSLGPLVEMLAAGNRVIIKPSDYTPACGELLRRMVAATFPEDLVAVAVGGLALAKAWPRSSRPCAGTTCSTPAARPSGARWPGPRRRTWCR
jgi:acyl-CoA reductase-like NAD-dependent aldehyde dehydrogenase